MPGTKKTIQEIIHSNRDENSFTARLFEGILFPRFYENQIKFTKFLEFLNQSSEANIEHLNNQKKLDLKTTNIPEDLRFIDAMLFVECVDLFSALGQPWEDKTEFDCMIFGESKNKKLHAIVIEVKAYTDVNINEIERQRVRLKKLKKSELFYDYHHFVLMSYDNFKNAGSKVLTTIIEEPNNVKVLTWEDFKEILITSNRFNKTDLKLFKTIRKNGKGKQLRYLIDNEHEND
jgi:hypothetical protein